MRPINVIIPMLRKWQGDCCICGWQIEHKMFEKTDIQYDLLLICLDFK